MLKKIKNSLFIFGLVAALVTGLSSCGGNELKVDPSIVIGPGNATTILGEDTSVAVLLADFKDTPEKVDLFKKDAEEATATDLTVKDNAIVIPTSTWAAGAYEIYVQADDVKSNVITLAIAKNANEKIIISPAVSGLKGDTLSIVVAFSNLKDEPSTVDVWVENAEEALAKGLAVTNNTISLSTSDLDSGSTNIYVVAGDLKSSTCAITLTTPVVVPPKTPAITIEGPKKVTKGGYSTYLNMTFKDIEGYDFINHPNISIYVDGIYKTSRDISKNKYDASTYMTNQEIGKHKVYLKMDNSTIKSNEIEFEVVEDTVDPEVTIKKADIKNQVELTWHPNGARYYHIYYSDSNDLSTASYYTDYSYTSESKYTYFFPLSATNGKYYFWIVPSNSRSAPVAADITTEPVEYTFTREAQTAPTGLTVTPVTGKANEINLTWADNKAAGYAAYYGYDSDFSNASRINYGAYTKDGYNVFFSSNGTYYFWVKPYDHSYTEDTPVSEAKAYEFTYTKPDKVTNVTTKVYTTTENSVEINWTKSNAKYYTVLFNATDNFSKATILSNNTLNTYAYKNRLPTAGNYYFWVIATDKGVYTEADAVKVEYTLATYDNDGIDTPENVNVTSSSGNVDIQITCNPVTISSQSSTYYWFYYSETNDPKTATRINDGFSTKSPSYTYSKNNFESNKTYYFWVKAAKGYSGSSYTSSNFSEAVSFIPRPTTE